jgi:hypothetical protein
MVIELTAELESAVKMRANENGVSADSYVREVLEREIGSAGKTSILPLRILSVSGLADTHTALWYLYSDVRLSVPAKAFIDRAREMQLREGQTAGAPMKATEVMIVRV